MEIAKKRLTKGFVSVILYKRVSEYFYAQMPLDYSICGENAPVNRWQSNG